MAKLSLKLVRPCENTIAIYGRGRWPSGEMPGGDTLGGDILDVLGQMPGGDAGEILW